MKQTKTVDSIVEEIKSKYQHRYGLPHIGVGPIDESVIEMALEKGLNPSYNSKDDCLVIRKVGKDRIVYYLSGPYGLFDRVSLYRERSGAGRAVIGVADGYPCMVGILVNRLVREA